MLIDLHVHSHLSKDCELDPLKVLERAATHGLDGIAFTETNTVDGYEEIIEVQKKSPLRAFVGLELNTDKGQYLCFFPDPSRAPEPVQLFGSNRDRPWPALECVAQLRALGAAVVASRPYDREGGVFAGDAILTMGPGQLCAVEGYNPKVRQTANDLAVEAAEALRLPCVGGSDTRSSLDELGRGATFFKRRIMSQADLVQALLSGECWAVQMGELPRLSRPGEAREVEKKGKKKRRRRA